MNLPQSSIVGKNLLRLIRDDCRTIFSCRASGYCRDFPIRPISTILIGGPNRFFRELAACPPLFPVPIAKRSWPSRTSLRAGRLSARNVKAALLCRLMTGRLMTGQRTTCLWPEGLPRSIVAWTFSTNWDRRPRARARAAGGFAAFSSSARPAARKAVRTSGRGRNQAQQMKLIIIGGGIALGVLVVVGLAVVLKDAFSGDEKTKEVEELRFGLTEKQRRQLFEDMFHAVDVKGVTKACRDEWRRLGAELKLNDSQISAVLKEGFDRGWDQPALEVTQDQKQKTNRKNWIEVINRTGKDPIMPL